jgi:branched-chain amino acid transport system substrate-binding protein
VTTFAEDGLTPHGQDFARRYQERFKEAPDLHAASAYDGARLLFEAMRRAKGTKPERLRETLLGLDNFDSLTGPLAIDKDDHGARRPVFVVQRQEGAQKVVKRYDADLK